MQRFLRTLWPYARLTMLSLLGISAAAAAFAYLFGARSACDFSNAFFWGAVLAILGGGLVAGIGGRGESEKSQTTGRRSLRELEQEKEQRRQERYQQREQSISYGIAIAVAAFPLLLVAWGLCPFA